MKAFCVVEPEIGQLMGACMLFRSLKANFRGNLDCKLGVLERHEGTELAIRTLAESLGVPTSVVLPISRNRYLNKWALLSNLPTEEHHTIVAAVDWDVIAVRPFSLTGIEPATVAARRNPAGMYADLLVPWLSGHPQRPDGVDNEGWITASINSGVVLSRGATIPHFLREVLEVERSLSAIDPVNEWKTAQAAESIVAGSCGLTELPDAWNVTPLSTIDDARVVLWHYNDSDLDSRTLKRNLTNPKTAEGCLLALEDRWPSSAGAFRGIYSTMIACAPVRAFVRR